MGLSDPTPPLLLTKRLTAFLHANQTTKLPTLILTTNHGKLLAHASPHPVSQLRTHATVAASLLTIHASSSVAIPSALPGSRTPDPIPTSPLDNEDDGEQGATTVEDGGDRGSRSTERKGLERSQSGRSLRERDSRTGTSPVTITVQLSGGTLVVRRLKCGLLFVCIGPSATPTSLSTPTTVTEQQPPHDSSESRRSLMPGSPSETASMTSAGGQTTASLDSVGSTAVAAMRRHAADLARWLDDKLGTLKVPEDGVGHA